MARRRYPSLSRRLFSDFSGGWNPHDDPFLLEENESPRCINVTLDQRGKIVDRLGLRRYNETEAGATAFDQLFYSEALQICVAQQGTSLYKTDGDGTMVGMVTPLPTANKVGFCDFLGKLLIIIPDSGPNGGVHTYDGTNYGPKIDKSPAGNQITPFQNFLLSSGDPAHPQRVIRSELGDTKWLMNATDPTVPLTFVDVRDENDSPITGLLVGQKLDNQGHPGLLIFKRRDLYRLHSVETTTFGAYELLGHNSGAIGQLAFATLNEKVLMVNEDGLWVTDGNSTPVLVSGKIEPLFDPIQLAYTQLHKAAVGFYRERFLISLPRVNSSVNNMTLEYDPEVGWIVPHSFGVNDFAMFRKNDERPFGAATQDGFIYDVFRGGTDDGVPIKAEWISRPLLLNMNGDARLRRVRITGRGEFDFFVVRDLARSRGKSFRVSIIPTSNMIWNQFHWNDGTLWGPNLLEDSVDFYSLGVGREFQFLFSKESTASAAGEPLFQYGNAREVGAWAVSALRLDFMPLGGS